MYAMPGPIEPTEVIGGSIAVYKDAWENPAETIKIIEEIVSDKNFQAPFTPAQTIGEVNTGVNTQSIRTNEYLMLHDASQYSEEIRTINNKMFELSLGASRWYTDYFGIESAMFFNETFQLLRYSGGQHYGAHHDGLTGTGRCISPILYLNDNYEGGDIEFVNYNIKIKPEAGMFLVFPSSFPYRHIAHPVSSGTKYAIVTWLHDRPAQQFGY